MNQLLKLKHCRYFLRKVYGDSFKYNHSICYSKMSGIQCIQMEMINLNQVPFIFSYNQIREYSTRGGKGKMSRGGKSRKMELTDEEMAEVIDIDDYRDQLNAVVERLKKDYVENLSIRSAFANIENILVKIDGEEYPLNELAVIAKKNPTLIAINMSDFPQGLKPAIQAIIDSGSNFNPQQDGTMIYLNVPKMTREHREKLAKSAKTLYSKSRDIIRTIQNTFMKEAKDKTELSEDLVFNASNQIKIMADQCSTDLEKMLKAKQKELLGES